MNSNVRNNFTKFIVSWIFQDGTQEKYIQLIVLTFTKNTTIAILFKVKKGTNWVHITNSSSNLSLGINTEFVGLVRKVMPYIQRSAELTLALTFHLLTEVFSTTLFFEADRLVTFYPPIIKVNFRFQISLKIRLFLQNSTDTFTEQITEKYFPVIKTKTAKRKLCLPFGE